MVAPVPAIRCRQITEADVAGVTALLARGFPEPHLQFWMHALASAWRGAAPPPDLPQYGYLLESGGSVGRRDAADLLDGARPAERRLTRCNLSSWYVEPAFRAYATLLVSHALGHKDVTYMNISPAPHTWPIIEAQGFSRYCDGVFVAVPMLNGLFGGAGVNVSRRRREPTVELRPVRAGHPARNTPITAASACGASRPNAPIRSCSVRALVKELSSPARN